MNRKERRARKKKQAANPSQTLSGGQHFPVQVQNAYAQGESFLAKQEYADAHMVFRSIVQAHPNHLKAAEQMGVAALHLKKFDEAMQVFQALMKADISGLSRYQAYMGSIYLAQGAYTQAIAFLEKASAGQSLHEISYSLSVAYLYRGEMEKAQAAAEDAMALRPDYAEYFFYYMKHFAKPESVDDANVQRLYEYIKDMEALSGEEQAALLFSLFEIERQLGLFESALEHAKKGAAIKRASLHYNAQAFDQYVTMVKNYFSPSFYASFQAEQSEDSNIPVLICGIARSGTTLLEQILNSHPDIAGIGEDPFFATLVSERSFLPAFEGHNYPIWHANQRKEPFLSPYGIGRRYVEYLKERAPDVQRVVEKGLDNVMNLGYMALALPQAKFIYIQRDPVDNCLSAFTTLFTFDAQSYSYDFEELAQRYRAHVTLMEHWQMLFPERIFTVSYEDLVADTEKHTRDILSFLGLAWDEGCLAFHKQDSTVKTASLQQVRKPIYKSSIARWKRYGGSVKPLIAALGDLASDEAQAFLRS